MPGLPVKRIFDALRDPRNFWKEVLRYGLFSKKSSPREWFFFRSLVARECALLRGPEGNIKSMPLEEVFPGIQKEQCRVRLLRPTAYNLTWDELISMGLITAFLKPRNVFEFGTFNGRTTTHLAMNAPEGSLVYTFDMQSGVFEFGADTPFFTKLKIGESFLSEPKEAQKIRMLTGDSKKFDFSDFQGRMDMVFIDGDHSYEGVLEDSKTASIMLKQGGYALWHDYLYVDDVTRAINHLAKKKNLISLKGTSLVIWQKPVYE